MEDPSRLHSSVVRISVNQSPISSHRSSAEIPDGIPEEHSPVELRRQNGQIADGHHNGNAGQNGQTPPPTKPRRSFQQHNANIYIQTLEAMNQEMEPHTVKNLPGQSGSDRMEPAGTGSLQSTPVVNHNGIGRDLHSPMSDIDKDLERHEKELLELKQSNERKIDPMADMENHRRQSHLPSGHETNNAFNRVTGGGKKLLAGKSLGSGADSNSSSFSGSDLSRSVSVFNLSATTERCSPSPVSEVRTITSNYQKLLAQATREIRTLSAAKTRLEEEMEKLLEANIELATESKRLLEEERAWKKEREGLMAANQEFVEEVERLYAEEEKWFEERQVLIEDKSSSEKNNETSRTEWQEQRKELEDQIEKLLESVKLLTFDNERLIKERDSEKQQNSKSVIELRSEFESELSKQKSTISKMQTQLNSELEERERLEHELEAISHELDQKSADDEEKTRKLAQLERRCENLSSTQFETQIENDKLIRELEELRKEEKRVKTELDQVKVEKEWLVTKGKEKVRVQDANESVHKEIEKLRDELKLERDKVSNMSNWKSQVVAKNKELQMENDRLRQRAEDLETLMNEEMTDINELITVINNIQSSGKVNAFDTGVLKKKYMK